MMWGIGSEGDSLLTNQAGAMRWARRAARGGGEAGICETSKTSEPISNLSLTSLEGNDGDEGA